MNKLKVIGLGLVVLQLGVASSYAMDHDFGLFGRLMGVYGMNGQRWEQSEDGQFHKAITKDDATIFKKMIGKNPNLLKGYRLDNNIFMDTCNRIIWENACKILCVLPQEFKVKCITDMHEAIGHNKHEMIQLLLDHGVDVNGSYISVLGDKRKYFLNFSRITFEQEKQTLSILLHAGAKVNVKDWLARDMFKTLWDWTRGWMPEESERLEKIKFLLKTGVLVLDKESQVIRYGIADALAQLKNDFYSPLEEQIKDDFHSPIRTYIVQTCARELLQCSGDMTKLSPVSAQLLLLIHYNGFLCTDRQVTRKKIVKHMVDGVEKEVTEDVVENVVVRSVRDWETWQEDGVVHMAFRVPRLQELCIRKMAKQMAHDPEEDMFRKLRGTVFAPEAQKVRDSLNKKLGITAALELAKKLSAKKLTVEELRSEEK